MDTGVLHFRSGAPLGSTLSPWRRSLCSHQTLQFTADTGLALGGFARGHSHIHKFLGVAGRRGDNKLPRTVT